jgi:hypothetical protein
MLYPPEVLGPLLSSDIEDLYPNEEHLISVARRIVAPGIKYLHSCGVVQGGM